LGGWRGTDLERFRDIGAVVAVHGECTHDVGGAPPSSSGLVWQATPGQMLISARIVDARTGARPTPGQCIGRWLGYLPSTLCLGLGFIWIGIDARKQGWHDKLAGTVVIQERRSSPVPACAPVAERQSSGACLPGACPGCGIRLRRRHRPPASRRHSHLRQASARGAGRIRPRGGHGCWIACTRSRPR